MVARALSHKSVIINLLDSIEDLRKIPDKIENELLRKIESYWYQMETEFETKMDASKTWRINITNWEPPNLWFKIIRHPGGLRSQTWVYDFDMNEAVLVSEGVIPLRARARATAHLFRHPFIDLSETLYFLSKIKGEARAHRTLKKGVVGMCDLISNVF